MRGRHGFIHVDRRVQLEFTMGQPIDLYRHLEEERGATLSSLSSRARLFILFFLINYYLFKCARCFY